MDTEVIIIGGGLAGLTAAIDLAQRGVKVLLIEKQSYPFHRVCGEYVSHEVRPYLAALGVDPFSWGALSLNRLQFSSPSARHALMRLPLGGFSISRYTLDYKLFQFAKRCGVNVWLQTRVKDVEFHKEAFTLRLTDGRQVTAPVVLAAFGKRSNLDRTLNRPFFRHPTPYLGVKFHAKLDFPVDQVSLHIFEQGYCGISRIENHRVNICYLVKAPKLREVKGDLNALELGIRKNNPYLGNLLAQAEPLFERPLVISNVSFAPKSALEQHMLVIGDAAGLIPPLSGNGMAMAIRSSQLAVPLVQAFLRKEISRPNMEQAYQRAWERAFSRRLWIGNRLQHLLFQTWFAETSVSAMRTFPQIARAVISQTHG